MEVEELFSFGLRMNYFVRNCLRLRYRFLGNDCSVVTSNQGRKHFGSRVLPRLPACPVHGHYALKYKGTCPRPPPQDQRQKTNLEGFRFASVHSLSIQDVAEEGDQFH